MGMEASKIPFQKICLKKRTRAFNVWNRPCLWTLGFKVLTLKNFAKFADLCQGLFFNKVAGLRPWRRCFPVNFAKFLRVSFFIEHLWWLLPLVFELIDKPARLNEPLIFDARMNCFIFTYTLQEHSQPDQH